jgi:hypothetical protein
MSSSRGDLALLARRELGEVAVVVTLPAVANRLAMRWWIGRGAGYSHLVVEDLGLAGLGLGDEGVVEHVEHILADLLELLLDLLAVLPDGVDVLVRALGLLLLLDRRDYAPRRTSCADYILVGYRKEVALVDGKFTTDL